MAPSLQTRPPPHRRAAALAAFAAAACVLQTCGASIHSIPEVKGALLSPSAATRSLASQAGEHGRRREGRAEPLGCGHLADDVSAESLLPPASATGSDAIAGPDNLVFGIPDDRRRDLAPEDDCLDDLELALPSFDPRRSDYLSSLLTRPPPHACLSWDVPSIRDPAPAPSEAEARLDASAPLLRKTGTTIVGVLCDSGRTVVIGADTRATDGTVVADKRCEKVHRLADNVWCCGAGTSGDIDALVRRVRYNFLLRGTIAGSIGNAPPDDEGDGEDSTSAWGRGSTIEGEQGSQYLPTASVSAICRYIRDHLYDAGGSIGANLVLGGYDVRTGRAVLTAIHPHGSMDVVPYTALGSGGLAATAVLESRYPSGGDRALTVEQAVRLVQDAVGAGIANDMGSGSQVDLCVIGREGVRYRRAVVGEEALRVSGGEEAADRALGHRHALDEGGEDVIMNGVNGFGSLPYFVKSRRVIMEGDEVVHKSRKKWLENVLDLEDGDEVNLDEV